MLGSEHMYILLIRKTNTHPSSFVYKNWECGKMNLVANPSSLVLNKHFTYLLMHIDKHEKGRFSQSLSLPFHHPLSLTQNHSNIIWSDQWIIYFSWDLFNVYFYTVYSYTGHTLPFLMILLTPTSQTQPAPRPAPLSLSLSLSLKIMEKP